MKAAERKELKAKIETTITETEAKIAQLEMETQPISPENSIGRVSRMDAINNKSVSEAALRTAKRKLSNLKHALAKVDSPDFGDCARCKNPIPAARLMFMPQSPYCVHCAD